MSRAVMYRVVPLLILMLGAALAALPAAASAQDGAARVAASAAQEPAFTAATQEPAQATGLPVRSGVDRTMRGYWHLFIAFAFTWVLLFGYAISLGRRFGALERRLERAGLER